MKINDHDERNDQCLAPRLARRRQTPPPPMIFRPRRRRFQTAYRLETAFPAEFAVSWFQQNNF
jgi:hypothetical protein